MVLENEDLPMPRTKERYVRGHSDIDIVAIDQNQLLHIECQTWWGPAKEHEENQLRRLKERFDEAREAIFDRYKFLDRNKLQIRDIFVTAGKPEKSRGNGPWDRLRKYCESHDIELVETNDIIRDLIMELKERYPKPAKVGKEKGIARFLIHLIHNDFLKRPESR